MKYENFVDQKLDNGNTINYKIYNGTAYHKNTPDQVVSILDRCLSGGRNTRLRIFYGDTATGRDWHEEHDVTGYIGRSTGSIKVPLLINNTRSTGGGAILDDNIIKIQHGNRVLYQHPIYNAGEITIADSDLPEYESNVLINGKIHARFKTTKQAERFAAFLKGERNSK